MTNSLLQLEQLYIKRKALKSDKADILLKELTLDNKKLILIPHKYLYNPPKNRLSYLCTQEGFKGESNYSSNTNIIGVAKYKSYADCKILESLYLYAPYIKLDITDKALLFGIPITLSLIKSIIIYTVYPTSDNLIEDVENQGLVFKPTDSELPIRSKFYKPDNSFCYIEDSDLTIEEVITHTFKYKNKYLYLTESKVVFKNNEKINIGSKVRLKLCKYKWEYIATTKISNNEKEFNITKGKIVPWDINLDSFNPSAAMGLQATLVKELLNYAE